MLSFFFSKDHSGCFWETELWGIGWELARVKAEIQCQGGLLVIQLRNDADLD